MDDLKSARTDIETAEPEPAASSPIVRKRTPIWLIALRVIVPILFVAVAIVFVGYLTATRPPVASKPIEEREWIVRTVLAKKISVAPELRLFGSVVPGREVELRPLVGGRVIRVGENFAEGGIVRKGELLVEIDPFDYQATQRERVAQLSEARSRLNEFRLELKGAEDSLTADQRQLKIRETDAERKELLVRRGTGSQKSLDDARLALNEQRQRIIDRRRQIATLKTKITQQLSAIARAEVALERAQKDLRETKLLAPFEGFLRNIQIAVGKKISTNDRVAQLIAAKRLEVSFQVSDEQYGRLVAAGAVRGKKAAILWRTRARTFKYSAVIERVSGQVASDTGGVVLYARIENTGLDTVLRPGVFVQVVIRDKVYKNVYRLPDEALARGKHVYVVVAGQKEGDAAAKEKTWRLERRTVKVVGRQGNDVLVQGGISPGDRIVAATFPEIGPGAKVIPR